MAFPNLQATERFGTVLYVHGQSGPLEQTPRLVGLALQGALVLPEQIEIARRSMLGMNASQGATSAECPAWCLSGEHAEDLLLKVAQPTERHCCAPSTS